MVDEIADQGHAAGGVHHLWVELNAVELAAVVGNRRFWGVVGVGQARKAIGEGLHRIPMAHPHRRTVVDVGQQIGGVVNKQRGFAVFTAF